MMLSSELDLEQLTTLYPEQIWLEISPDDRATAQRQTDAHRYTNDTAKERAFLNTLCLNTIATFLSEEPDLLPAEIWLEPSDRPAVWELVNGSVLIVGNTRLALIPTDSDRFDTLIVEQEWVDIPTWAAHYYLAVQLNLEADWLRIVGYASHEQLQRNENFSSQERVYCLSRSRLIEDLNVLWIARQASPDWNPIVAPLSELSNAPDLITQLSQVTAYSPRLERSFEQWGALIANSEERRSLHQQRLQRLTPIAHLSRWLRNQFEASWQAIQDWTNFPELVLAGDNSKSVLQGWHQVIVLDQQTFNLIVVCQPGEMADQIEVTIALHRSEATPLPSQLQLTLTEQNPEGQEIPFFSLNFAAGGDDRLFQLPSLNFSPGERFSATFRMGDSQFTQEFLI